MIVGIYVDDLLLLARTLDLITELKEMLAQRFRLKDLGEVSFYLGMQVIRDRENRAIYINQTAYINKVLKDLGMEDCRPVKTPMDEGVQLHQAEDGYKATAEDQEGYRKIIGCLQWLATMTRPDISYAVSRCARYSNNPSPIHDKALKRIIRYLTGTRHLGLHYGPKENDSGTLIGYTDSSWRDCPDTRRSTSAYVFQLYNGPISWHSKRQTTVAASTAEAEYVGEAIAAREAKFLAALLKEMGYEGSDVDCVRLYGDNQAAIKMTVNPINHPRTKHIDADYHQVREMVSETGELEMRYIQTDDMAADALTKPLGPLKHERAISQLGMKSLHQE